MTAKTNNKIIIVLVALGLLAMVLVAGGIDAEAAEVMHISY